MWATQAEPWGQPELAVHPLIPQYPPLKVRQVGAVAAHWLFEVQAAPTPRPAAVLPQEESRLEVRRTPAQVRNAPPKIHVNLRMNSL